MHQCVQAALPMMAWPSPVYTNELLKFLWWLVKTTALLVAHFLTGFSLTAIIYEKTTPLTAYLCTKVWRILTLHWSKNSHYIANQSCSWQVISIQWPYVLAIIKDCESYKYEIFSLPIEDMIISTKSVDRSLSNMIPILVPL